MDTTTAATQSQSIFAEARRSSPLLITTALVMIVCAIASVVLAFVDPRTLWGASLWIKPVKFFVSVGVYLGTAAWLFTQIDGYDRAKKWIARALSGMLGLEMIAVAGQAARGKLSHFNNETPFDTFVARGMGVAILVVFIATLVLAVLVFRAKKGDETMRLGVRVGMIVTILGMLTGAFMVTPSADQLAMKASGQSVVMGSHTFGAPDGGPGIPLVGWSSRVGDMRPAHFLGLHAMQILPLFAWAVSRRRTSNSRKRALVVGAGVLHGGFVVTLCVQALRRQSIIAPDAFTIGLLLLVIALAGIVTLYMSEKRSSSTLEMAHANGGAR